MDIFFALKDLETLIRINENNEPLSTIRLCFSYFKIIDFIDYLYQKIVDKLFNSNALFFPVKQKLMFYSE